MVGAFEYYVGARETHYIGDECEVLGKYEGGEWVAEPKIDGQWCCVFVDGSGRVSLIKSRWGKVKNDATTDGLLGRRIFPGDTVLIGELEAGSEWATREYAKIGHRRVHLFDVVKFAGADVRSMPLNERRELLEMRLEGMCCADHFFPIVQQWHEAFSMHYQEVVYLGGEGLMLKRADSPYMADRPDSKGKKTGNWVKAKKMLTQEYVVCREVTAEKGGRGAKLGLFVDGKLKEVMQMQMPPDVLDRCRRHAFFLGVRWERPAESCTLEQ